MTINGSTTGVALIGRYNDPGGGYGADVWRIINPASGTPTVVITLTGPCEAWATGVEVEDVHQTTPVRPLSVQTAGGAANPLSVSVPSAVGDLVFDFIAGDSGSRTVGAGQTQYVNNSASDWQGASTEPGASTVTMSWSGTIFAGMVAFSLQPPAGGTPQALESTGTVLVQGTAALLLQKLLAAVGEVLVQGTAALSVSKPLASAGEVAPQGAAGMSVQKPIEAQGTVQVQGSVSLSGAAELQTNGTVLVQGSAQLSVTKPLGSTGEVAVSSSTELQVIRGLATVGTVQLEGGAVLQVQKLLSSSGQVVPQASAELQVGELLILEIIDRTLLFQRTIERDLEFARTIERTLRF